MSTPAPVDTDRLAEQYVEELARTYPQIRFELETSNANYWVIRWAEGPLVDEVRQLLPPGLLAVHLREVSATTIATHLTGRWLRGESLDVTDTRLLEAVGSHPHPQVAHFSSLVLQAARVDIGVAWAERYSVRGRAECASRIADTVRTLGPAIAAAADIDLADLAARA